jgi:protein tyrosine phosphatase
LYAEGSISFLKLIHKSKDLNMRCKGKKNNGNPNSSTMYKEKEKRNKVRRYIFIVPYNKNIVTRRDLYNPRWWLKIKLAP